MLLLARWGQGVKHFQVSPSKYVRFPQIIPTGSRFQLLNKATQLINEAPIAFRAICMHDRWTRDRWKHGGTNGQDRWFYYGILFFGWYREIPGDEFYLWSFPQAWQGPLMPGTDHPNLQRCDKKPSDG